MAFVKQYRPRSACASAQSYQDKTLFTYYLQKLMSACVDYDKTEQVDRLI